MNLKTLCKRGLLLLPAFLTAELFANSGNGWDHGYYWGMWSNSGTVSMTFPYAATYAGNWLCKWTNIGDGGGGKGWNPGADSRSVNYNSGSTSGFKNFGAYGFAPYPDYEMYIQDRCSSQGGTTYKGSLNSDGGTYSVYTGKQSSASGGGPQYVSKRTSNTSGSGNHKITTQNHMNWWKSHGMTHGTWNTWTLNVEDYGTSVSGSCGGTVW